MNDLKNAMMKSTSSMLGRIHSMLNIFCPIKTVHKAILSFYLFSVNKTCTFN